MAKKTILRAKQERFCQEYIKDSNGAQAAIRAGYSVKAAKAVASRMLTFANVKTRLAELHEKLDSKAIMTASEVLEELSRLGRTDMADFVDVDEGGAIKVKAFAQMTPGATRCIRKIKEKRTIKQSPGDSPDMILESTVELELWNKVESLEMLGRHRNLFNPDDDEKDKPFTLNLNFTDAKKS